MAEVGEHRKPISGTERVIPCDTLLLSVGLLPENELTRKLQVNIDPRTGGAFVDQRMETSIPGVFACGNVVHVHDLVDFVTMESQRAGEEAARFVLGRGNAETREMPSKRESAAILSAEKKECRLENGANVSYTVPQLLSEEELTLSKTDIFFRVNRIFGKCTAQILSSASVIAEFKKEYMFPGEMQKVTLSPSVFQRIMSEKSVTFQVTEV